MFFVFWEGATKPSFKYKRKQDAEIMVRKMWGQKKGYIEQHCNKDYKNVIIRLNVQY
jgi:hypothetical protein